MESNLLMGLVGILRESQEIFFKQKRLMGSFILTILLVHSILLMFNLLSIKPLIDDLIAKENLLFMTSPSSSEFANILIAMAINLKYFIGIEGLFFLALSIISLFSTTTTIITSAMTYRGLKLAFKDLVMNVMRSWKRPTITWFCSSLFDIGYIFLALLIFLPLGLNFSGQSDSSVFSGTILIIEASIYMYLGVLWNLALVVSVLEEKCGFEALGKAGQLVMGMKTQGFLLNLLFGFLSFLVLMVLNVFHIKPSEGIVLVIGLLVLNLTWLIKMFALMAFTVLYHICKKSKGEEIELQGSFGCIETPTAPLLGAAMP